jgi:hypothetical protein
MEQTPTLSERLAAYKAALAFGVAFEMPPELVDLYSRAGNDLPVLNGNGRWVLPVPATYVIDREGRIVYAHIEADYRERAEPDDIDPDQRPNQRVDAAECVETTLHREAHDPDRHPALSRLRRRRLFRSADGGCHPGLASRAACLLFSAKARDGHIRILRHQVRLLWRK